MEFSFQDSSKNHARSSFAPLSSQSGQGILEYILVLLVAVAVIMGGIYQLNDAFKVWAENYFGNYIACLLETGDLPSIGGTPGDSGVCNQLFEPFSLAKGRKLKPIGPTSGSGDPGGGGSSSSGKTDTTDNKNGRPDYQVSGGGGRGSVGKGGWAGSGGRSRLVRMTPSGQNQEEGAANTGSTKVSSGSGGLRSEQKFNRRERILLDNRSLANTGDEDGNKKRQSGVSNSSGGSIKTKNRIPLRRDRLKDAAVEDDEPFTFGNFIRILLIAAIIIALVMVIGGQLMSMGKMEQ